jgi:serine/threonine protein kinase
MPGRLSSAQQHLSQPTFPAEVSERLDRLLDRFEAAWRSGGRPSLREYLAEAVAERRVLLRELALIDLEHRLKAGEDAAAGDYLGQFPELADDLSAAIELIAAEFVLREQHGEKPRLEDYQARFPRYAEGLVERVNTWRGRVADSLRPPQQPAEPETMPPVAAAGRAEAVTAPPVPAPSPLEDECPAAPPTRMPSPMPQPEAPSAANLRSSRRLGRYELGEVIAEGGMGAVILARDPTLNRALAVKVLRPELQDRPDLVRRFVEEAQITAQLPHPSIVPVHELGHDENGLPFLAMKLVRGQTLAELLASRTPGETSFSSTDEEDEFASDLLLGKVPLVGRLIVIFEQVCLAMAFAHSHRVIHRDLKPANIMVGHFGEVQVMDWGLAKVLGDTQTEEGTTVREPASSVIHTIRSGPGAGSPRASAGETEAGTVLGTPAYMPPEQGEGQVQQLDERCDVFALGAILCEILTGKPPYVASENWRILYMAASGDVADAVTRLNRCGADAELVGLAKECLNPNREQRPRDAGIVAGRVTAYQRGVEDRLHQAENERTAAEVRAEQATARAQAHQVKADALRLVSHQTMHLKFLRFMVALAGLIGACWVFPLCGLLIPVRVWVFLPLAMSGILFGALLISWINPWRNREQRPRDAGIVAGRVTAYQRGGKDRLQRAEKLVSQQTVHLKFLRFMVALAGLIGVCDWFARYTYLTQYEVWRYLPLAMSGILVGVLLISWINPWRK